MTALATCATELPIPRIETERLVLRGPEPQDFDPVTELMSDAERARFIGGPVTDENLHWRSFLAVIGHWMWRGYGMWTFADRASGRPLGRAGVINHLAWDEPELGWHLFNGCEGKGYATEAVQAARRYAADNWGLDRLVSYIDPDNTRSRALADRLGARVEGEGTLLGHPCLLCRHPAVAKGAA